MRIPSRALVEYVKKAYPAGTKVELVEMDDVQAPPPGTRGIVRHVDDVCNIGVNWENGCGLNIVYGVDKFKVVRD